MVNAASRAGHKPWHLSFMAAVQTANEFLPGTLGVTDIGTRVRTLFKAIATHIIGPNRVEPRVVKRRPKGCKQMNKPREIHRKSLSSIGN